MPDLHLKRNHRKLNPSKALELARKGVSNPDIAKIQGVHRSTPWRFMDSIKEKEQQFVELKSFLPDALLEGIANNIEIKQRIDNEILALSPEELKKIPHATKQTIKRTATVDMGVSIEKRQLIMGEPTENFGFSGMLADLKEKKKEEIEIEIEVGSNLPIFKDMDRESRELDIQLGELSTSLSMKLSTETPKMLLSGASEGQK